MQNNSKTLLLTFETITNPVVLLQSIIIQRNIGGKLLVREENMKACNDQGMHEYEDDLRDPSFIDYLEGWIVKEAGIRSKKDLTLEQGNIILSVQILQFALKEGYIELIHDKFNLEDRRILENPENKTLFDNIYATFDYGIWCLTNQWHSKSCVIADIKTSLDKGYSLAIGNKKENYPQKFVNIFKADKSSLLREAIKELRFTEFKEICYLIEKPKIMTVISEAFVEIVERKSLKQDIILFMPRLLMDNLTFGVSGLAELLWRYHKKRNS